jgi:hypothetical protein
VGSTPQATPQQWVALACQTLQPTFDQLGAPSQLDINNPAATWQAYLTYLGKARDAAQEAIDRLSSVGVPRWTGQIP